MAETLSTEAIIREGGTFATLKKRLTDHVGSLRNTVKSLNEEREAKFGASSMDVLGRVRVRTPHNCVARDVVRLGDFLLFGFNVEHGLKQTVDLTEVFSLYRLEEDEGNWEITQSEMTGSFLDDEKFRTDFASLYRFHKEARLIQLLASDARLLMVFQVGDRGDHVKVFRWSLNNDGSVRAYIDDRGADDFRLPERFDFEWTQLNREHMVQGVSPHYSIDDQLFVDNTGGAITFKVENNTSSGEGIFEDPLEVTSQSLSDGVFEYAKRGEIYLIRVKPYGEDLTRYYIFNPAEKTLHRQDALAGSVRTLPENHGLVFPGGIYLYDDELKTVDVPEGLRFKRMVEAPNGEDVLIVFYAPESGAVALVRYNLINRTTAPPITGHGYALFEGGVLAVFTATDKQSQVHPVQLWKTPFESQSFYADKTSSDDSDMGRIGNPELVSGIADLYGVVKLADLEEAGLRHFNTLIKRVDKLLDQRFWLHEDHFQSINKALHSVRSTAELMVDEYEKVESVRAQSNQALNDADKALSVLIQETRPESWREPHQFVAHLKKLRDHRGLIRSLTERRYIDRPRLESLDRKAAEAVDKLAERTLDFLSKPEALARYTQQVDALRKQVEDSEDRKELQRLVDDYQEITDGLDFVQELLSSLTSDDTEQQATIADNLSTLYARVNQDRSRAEIKLNECGLEEAKLQFASKLRLYEQSLANGVHSVDTPDDCDGLLARMLNQLQEIESQFGEFDEFLSALIEQRETTQETIEARRQQLAQERQRKAASLKEAGQRILNNLTKRSDQFDDVAEVHAFFASDAMVAKVRDLAARLKELDAPLDADDLASQLKAAQDNAQRAVRDRADIYEEGGAIIRLGPKHRFSVNRQEPAVTLIPDTEGLKLHISGTQFYETVRDDRLAGLDDCWGLHTPAEAPDVYKAEYLAHRFMDAVEKGDAQVPEWSDPKAVEKAVKQFAGPRYRDGYEKGIHDHDAARILHKLAPAKAEAGLLRFAPLVRSVAILFWSFQSSGYHQRLQAESTSAGVLQKLMRSGDLLHQIQQAVKGDIKAFCERYELGFEDWIQEQAADYLCRALAEAPNTFEVSAVGNDLKARFTEYLRIEQQTKVFDEVVAEATDDPKRFWQTVLHWVTALARQDDHPLSEHFCPEAAILLIAEQRPSIGRFVPRQAQLTFEIDGLLGRHERLENQSLALALDEFETRLRRHINERLPRWETLQKIRHQVLSEQQDRLRVEEFTAKPLTSFVRNKLISEVYLPLVGDNLAKQMGTVGDDRRTDLMGLLIMISPPGYGKTTLMEYVASRLGLIFMKINCPSLGHEVKSLDPERAPNSAARTELTKLNLAFEMGNNVMLYLDDIQHTHPEFLQKFISLCDGTRRIEGVWNGKTKTYDMRGKRFAICMGGNPYTESGETFQIPDMLANRADVRNLGDQLSGMDDVFALSYLENAMSSNAVTAPLASRGMDDFYRFAEMAAGNEVNAADFDHDYSAAEREEIVAVLKRLLRVRDVVLSVNQTYIASSGQDDAYRTEPPFKLQGSYRNMNKLAEKVSPVMSEAELEQLIDDHYQGEAQLLTQGAEENLLKLRELRGVLTDTERERWDSIKASYRAKVMAGGDGDSGEKVVQQLVGIGDHLKVLSAAVATASSKDHSQNDWEPLIAGLQQAIGSMTVAPEITYTGPDGMKEALLSLADVYSESITPLVRVLRSKTTLELKSYRMLEEMNQQLADMEEALRNRAEALFK
ncbi:DNA repair ATPase [Marinobacter oulmenensis]|uniref:Flagellin-specific chaperone FliS n=1 Tax=Marinobacter oulmenensis TaxID=643747 RepID=A0A840UH94_9GAMM|nr:DNA repair ATPase [Marinobacter oulmenensis]MBB5320526.1 flagellin-specific chaperone FliS [Marinobacter oulmenensis]